MSEHCACANTICDSLDMKLTSIYDHAKDFNYNKNVVCYQCQTFLDRRLTCPQMHFKQSGVCLEPRKSCCPRREHPDEVKTPILGTHLRMSNDGYARKVECGERFIG